jgi:hypothetical protein
MLAACTASPSTPPPESDGTFQYSATNAAGKTLLVGKIALVFANDSVITGTWQLAPAPGVDAKDIPGSQVGSGTLRGRRVDGKLVLDLNPGYADNNVTLEASSATSGYSGTWSWSSFAGPQAGGKFKAVREVR